ncbi:MAG: thiamine-phosphate kinase [Blastocatellia bacterium]|nr:thiamine-phosphate kinase [Blastocatellia bacterium]
MRTERQFLRQWQQRLKRPAPAVLVGIGDDAAVLAPPNGSNLVIASDVMVEDVHFRRRYFPPLALGHKALAVNLSDMAAMGAIPRYCLVTLAIPKNCFDTHADAIMQGLTTLADEHQVVVIGGDTAAAPERIFVDVTILGECPPEQAVLRSTAQPGDWLYVTGELGTAMAGCVILEQQASTLSQQTLPPALKDAIHKHLYPTPRLFVGQQLAARKLASSMMDLSDGLSIDLSRLCEASNVGCHIKANQIPVSTAARLFSHRNRQNAIELALHGGEEYELLFTVSPARRNDFEAFAKELAAGPDAVEFSCLGEIKDVSHGLKIETTNGIFPLPVKGFDHFS